MFTAPGWISSPGRYNFIIFLPGVLYLPRLRPVGGQKGFKWRSRAKTGTFSGVVFNLLNNKPTKTTGAMWGKSNRAILIFMEAWTGTRRMVLRFLILL